MKSPRVLIAAFASVAVLSTATFVAGSRIGDAGDRAPSDRFGVVVETAEELAEGAAVSVSDDDLARAAIQGMLEALDDPYASVLSPEQRRQVEELLGGSIVGIGVWLESDPDGLRVSSIVEETPAARSGLQEGDVITEIDGHPVEGLSTEEASEFVRGPVGTMVELGVLRDDRSRSIRVQRARIHLSDVESRMLEGDVAYVRLVQFGHGAAEELREALRGLFDEGAQRVVLDLRGNGGGLADEAVRIASIFLDGGVVARVRERDAPERELRARGGEVLPRTPLVVLVDGGTASASELVAGALKDRGRATLVGTRTFGKGSVLTVSDLEGESQIQYTTAFFLTPDGNAIEDVGVEPDVQVLPGGPDDAQLDEALRVLRG